MSKGMRLPAKIALDGSLQRQLRRLWGRLTVMVVKVRSLMGTSVQRHPLCHEVSPFFL
jgi:hypothetical protein